MLHPLSQEESILYMNWKGNDKENIQHFSEETWWVYLAPEI